MKKEILLANKRRIIKAIGVVVFLFIAFRVFCSVTYLFRNTGYGRNHMVGIKSEAQLDMVYIGGSAAFVYWQPLRAWADCGFTSYSYATNTIQAENLKAYLKEARHYQNPKLYVVGLRAFQIYSDSPSEAGLRNGSDGMDITSPARYEMLNDYFSNRNIDENTDILSYYLDIAKYHTNTGNLASNIAWGFLNNEGTSPNKGWEWVDIYGYVEEPVDFRTEERAVLPNNAVKILNDLLLYCKENELNVLFVVCPYDLSREDQAKYNTIKDMVEAEGFNFLNANEHYDDMGLDFSKDFYNGNHVNLFGAAKYTKFLENYIMMHYDMPDHRTDPNYTSWDQDAERFFEEEIIHAETVTGLRIDAERRIHEFLEQMEDASNLSEWYNIASDSGFTLLVASTGSCCWPDNIADQKVLDKWGITDASKELIRVLRGSELMYSNEFDGAQTYTGTAGRWDSVGYCISIENGICSISINGKNLVMSQEGINIVVIDDTYQKLVAQVVLFCDKDGRILIRI